MCGVFGYVGKEADVGATIISALKTLEYRGYDSWGLAISTGDNLLVDKETGRINGHCRDYPLSRTGIGHTRWATHGGVTPANAHPHLDRGGRIAVVHNGIIENHVALRDELRARGHEFASETDSEVVAHLVSERLATGDSLPVAVGQVFDRLEGYNAIVVLDREVEQFAAAKSVSPLVIGTGEEAATIASDAVALRGHADRLVYLEDGQLALVSADRVSVFDRATMREVEPFSVPMGQVADDIARGDYPDFMSKEIAEQPATLRRLVGEARHECAALASAIDSARRVLLIGCGTATNAALAGSYLFNDICDREVVAVPASEFRYRSRFLDEETLVVAISQSGETLDVLEAMDEARRRGARLAAIVNTANSSLDRRVDTRVHLRSGVEQCVLATKSYTAMLATLLMTAYELRGDGDTGAELVRRAADVIEAMTRDGIAWQAQGIGRRIAASEHLFAVGRGAHYPSALEAALKIKEVSYVHAEGFASGELKHGVIALIEPGTPCLVFAPDDVTRTDIISGATELRSRGGRIIGVGSQNDDVFDDFIEVPDVAEATVIAEALPGQLLGYFAAIARGNDPDRPRNLAKSVTVK
jgi:glucosamine--fructose-6-phosphate aminotransferase (isomerizing)